MNSWSSKKPSLVTARACVLIFQAFQLFSSSVQFCGLSRLPYPCRPESRKRNKLIDAYRLETVIYILKDVRKKSYSLEKELEKNGNLSQEGIQMVAKQKECDKEYNQKMQTILGSEEIKNVLEKEISW